MSADEAELAAVLDKPTITDGAVRGYSPTPPDPAIPQELLEQLTGSTQWATSDEKRFRPMSRTVAALKPGLYDIQLLNGIGLVFERIDIKTENVLRFPDTPTDTIINEIDRFWSRGEAFGKYGLSHKRGILLWGEPGGGKSCTIALILQDVIARGGVGFRFNSTPSLMSLGLRAFRAIQPKTPIVVLMEDIDSIIEHFNESDVLNLLDGAESIERTVFLASTNYPERLGARIVNRPSRFDRRFKIGAPSEAARLMYLEHMAGAGAHVAVEQWAADTAGLSFAHLKELFVAVEILGNHYGETLELLKRMSKRVTSEDDRTRMGFGGNGGVPTASLTHEEIWRQP